MLDKKLYENVCPVLLGQWVAMNNSGVQYQYQYQHQYQFLKLLDKKLYENVCPVLLGQWAAMNNSRVQVTAIIPAANTQPQWEKATKAAEKKGN